MLRLKHQHIAYFSPISHPEHDADFEFINQTFQLGLHRDDMIGVTLDQALQMMSEGATHRLYERLVTKLQTLRTQFDFVVIQGADINRHSSSIDIDINQELAKNFNSPHVLVINGKHKSEAEIKQTLEMEINGSQNPLPFAFFVNRVETTLAKMGTHSFDIPVFYIPEKDHLNLPTVDEVATALQGVKIGGKNARWNRWVVEPIVAAMTPEHYLPRVQEGDLVIVPGDRTDILLASAMSMADRTLPNIAGIVLTGGIKPAKVIDKIMRHFNNGLLPIIVVKEDTYQTAMRASKVVAKFSHQNPQRTNMALGHFDLWVDRDCLMKHFDQHRAHQNLMTPTMFEFSLFEKAREKLKTIVLPEAEDERILRACEVLLNRRVIKPILLGKPQEIKYKASLLGIRLHGATIIDPEQSEWKAEFIEHFYQMRKHKGLPIDVARDLMNHVNYFATMMVETGKADGMVSGATHSTADTVRPALQIIKTTPSIHRVSSVFFMCFDSRVLVFGDCAINQNPTAKELAEIATLSGDTAERFGIDAKVALLSYSTGESGQGDEVNKVIEATKMAQSQQPERLIEGPLQYDAAIDSEVAKQKSPHSQVAGQASVFIFPDLNTGNNTYKAVQRAADVVAIGPVLQGLNKPINDLSRGCTVADIINTVAITAIQAQHNTPSKTR